MAKKLTFDDVKHRMVKIHPEIELLQDFYVDASAKMRCRCKTCENIFEMNWLTFQQGSSCPECAKKRRSKLKTLTIEEVKKRIETINPNVEILSTEYISSKEKLICKCKIDGHEWGIRWGNLSKGQGCPICARKKDRISRRIPLEKMKEELLEINPNIEILKREQVNGAAKLMCKCLVDGNQWWATWSNLKKSKGCPECAKLSIRKIKERMRVINPNIEILSDVYENAKGRLHCRCIIDGYEWETTWRILSENHGCPECAGNAKLNIDIVKERMAIIDPTIEILSDIYINGTVKLDCRCRIDGHLWSSPYNSLRQGKGCRECWIRNTSGENSKFWDGGVTLLHKYLRLSAKQWKKDSIIACGHKCVITGEPFDDVHHLYGFDIICKETMNRCGLPIYQDIGKYTQDELKLIDDTCKQIHDEHGLGICLKKDIHDLFHSEFGYGGNIPEQFEKFLKEKEMVRIA